MKQKQSFKQVIDNNLFILKICLKAAPLFIITYVLNIVRHQGLIFLEHTYGIGFVLESVEFGRPFREVAIFIIILFFLILAGMIFGAFAEEFFARKGLPKIKQKVKCMLYEKAQELDLECYDNPEYYNEFVLAVSEADKQVDRMLELLSKVTYGLTVFFTTGIFFLFKDSVSMFFVILSFASSFIFMQIFNKINYKIRLEKNPNERKRAYVNRVFYLNDYAKELRLNPDDSSKMFKKFKEANDAIYEIDKANAKRKFIITFIKDYVCNDFISDVLYITYLVYKTVAVHAISRVFYKDCSLIILDEPSSALDPIAEYQLNHSMLEATFNKTVIFISHRLSTTRLADKIFMLENGNIIEEGSHEELLKMNGKYAEMWRVQAGQYLAV